MSGFMDRFRRNAYSNMREEMANDVFHWVGNGAPTSGTSGTGAGIGGPGTTYYDYTNNILYMNTGTKASPTWTVQNIDKVTGDVTFAAGVSSLAASLEVKVTGTIASADITGTGAGQLGHANGVPLVAAQGATKYVRLKSCLLEMDFDTAAYTAGGACSIRQSGGGVEVSNSVAAASFIQAAADVAYLLEPPFGLPGYPGAFALNKGLNLVSAAAPTNPGTAAGVIKYTLAYQVLTSLLD